MTTKTNNCGTRRLGLRGGLMAVAVFTAAGLFAGCGGGGGAVCADTAIQVSWHLKQNGQVVQCLPGDTVTVVVDDSAQTTMDYPCSDQAEVTPDVQGGVVHSIAFTLSDGTGAALSQTNDMGLSVGCGGVSTAPEVEFDL